ncbi:sulfonate transport system permease protein [Xanthobacter flavus]|uniref:ABC transporter permease n=1 Tax=Xanthobacter flavus TaxID=281 RepID=A0A9W6CRM3_XANFL|nr:ABC transporter permease [Xanthobacter flavus]MDR6336469.1 sulfonate transport system permease protein [Xanthobacter flavus]GLI25180.1 ABC transporter permease [Xanthobacter flavus]
MTVQQPAPSFLASGAGQPPRGVKLDLVDLSPRAGQTLARSRFSTSARFASRALVPALLLAVWQASSNFGLVAPEVLPSPAEIIAAYAELIRTGELQAAIPASLARALTGLALGASVGLVLGLFAGLWRVGEELFDAPLQMLRTIPFIAMIPLFIIWFGIGEQAKIALIFGATIFPVYLNTYSGVRGVDQKLIEAAQVFGLSHGRIATRVIIPTALPSILVGLRFAAGVSLLALVAAEQINARSGIGFILINANQNQRTDIIIAGIIVYALLGIAIDLVMRVVERLALPWRPSLVLA